MGEFVRLEMTVDEALVLFELLSGYSESGSLTVTHQAEQRVLWNLHCLLERQLVEPFDPDYETLLTAARDRLRDSLE